MRFKLIVAMVNPNITNNIIETAKAKGATGDVILSGRGTGIEETKLFGISVADKTDVILFLVEEHIVKPIMDGFNEECKIEEPGNGIAMVLSIDKVAGLDRQIEAIKNKLREEQL
jgi:hypothetical protein